MGLNDLLTAAIVIMGAGLITLFVHVWWQMNHDQRDPRRPHPRNRPRPR